MHASQILDELRAELLDVPPEQKLAYIKGRIRGIENLSDRQIVENAISIGLEYGMESLKAKCVVALIHGIGTYALWFDKLQDSLKNNDNVVVLRIKYGYFDLLSFWLPIPVFRLIPIRRTTNELRHIRANYPRDELVVVAHSFGTYLVSKILKRNSDLQLERLLMCGAIVPENYKWHTLPNFPEQTPVNDCGSRDFLPMLAKTITLGYGSSGTVGFNSHKINNRYFDFGHSGFFSDENFREFWHPYILSGKLEVSQWDSERPEPPILFSMLSLFPGQLLVIVITVVALLLA